MSDLLGNIFTVAILFVSLQVIGDFLTDLLRMGGQLISGGLKQ